MCRHLFKHRGAPPSIKSWYSLIIQISVVTVFATTGFGFSIYMLIGPVSEKVHFTLKHTQLAGAPTPLQPSQMTRREKPVPPYTRRVSSLLGFSHAATPCAVLQPAVDDPVALKLSLLIMRLQDSYRNSPFRGRSPKCYVGLVLHHPKKGTVAVVHRRSNAIPQHHLKHDAIARGLFCPQ